MHSPEALAFSIPRPWPQRVSWTRSHLYWPSMIDIWHMEPGGHDALTVCGKDVSGKRTCAWRWHVHHWQISVRPWGSLNRWLFSRCAKCHRRFPWGYAPISHQWDGPGPRPFQGEPGVYHHECSSLVSVLQRREQDDELVKLLFAQLCQATEENEATVLARLTDPTIRPKSMEFMLAFNLTHLLGYDRDEAYNLVKRPTTHNNEVAN